MSDTKETYMLLSIADVLALIPVARSTLYLWMQKEDFPKPVRMGTRVMWKSEEIHAYIDSKQDKIQEA
jgi:predicted DNA-binding transcriptional regulator AlpA